MEEKKEGVEVEVPRVGFGYTESTEKMDNTLELEEEEADRKAVAEVDMKNPGEAEVDTDFSPEVVVEERNQDADNLKSNSAVYRKIHHNPNSASTDFPLIETPVAEDSDSAAAAVEEQNSTEMVEGMAYTKPWTLN